MNTDVQVLEDIANIGKEEGERLMAEIDDIRNYERAMGFLGKIRMDEGFNKLLKFLSLYRIREKKLYRNNYSTWAEFCGSVGMSKRTVDENISDLAPFLEDFRADFAQIFDVPFSKIRYLGKEIGRKSAQIDDDALIVDDHRIELKPENREEIEALIDEIKASHKREREALGDQVGAQKKVALNKQKRIEQLEKEIARYERSTEKEGYDNPDEKRYCKDLQEIRTRFDGILAMLNPERGGADIVPAPATPQMQAAYVSLLQYMRQCTKAYWDDGATLLMREAGQGDEEWSGFAVIEGKAAE